MRDGQRVPQAATGETAEQEASLAEEVAPGTSVPPFGVIGHDGQGPGGPGFGSGTTLDGLEPGPVLVAALDETWDAGLARLSDDELAGVALAWRRCESRAAAGLLAAVGELSRRRTAGGNRQVIDHVDDEVAILLALTRRSAGRLLDFAGSLARMPATMAALSSGRIDRAKADVIAYETGLLDDSLAAAVEQLVIEDAPTLTTSGLQARLHRAVLAADPDAARRRAERAVKDARVELINERSGTAGLAGRDLPVAATLAADQRVDATARALKAAGATATLARLRAAVFLGLLTGHDPLGFLPEPDQGSPGSDPEAPASESGHPAPGPRPTTSEPEAPMSRPDAGARPDARSGPDSQCGPDTSHGPDIGAGPPIRRGSVHLTMPLTAWLGLTQSPGDIRGFGPASAEICREIADLIAQNPGSRWCLTLTDVNGHAVGHGCARRPPGRTPRPPGGMASGLDAIMGWLAGLRTGPVQAGSCSHAREVPGYRIPESLHHIVKTRQRTCSAPYCNRPAERCDDDHTLPYDQGGRTCECDLAPLCRRDHQAKQAQGWRLLQPSPGVLVWGLPHGRRYLVTPGVYPT
jgi:hypothetical protein